MSAKRKRKVTSTSSEAKPASVLKHALQASRLRSRIPAEAKDRINPTSLTCFFDGHIIWTSL